MNTNSPNHNRPANQRNQNASSRFAAKPLFAKGLAGVMAIALAAGSSLAMAATPLPIQHDQVPQVAEHSSNSDSQQASSNKASASANEGVLVVETETFAPAPFDPIAALDLSDKQVDKITEINDHKRKELWKLQGAEMEMQNKLRDLYADEQFDAHAIMKANHTLAAVHEKMINVRSDAQTRIYDILTPEQRAMI